ncbi:MAG: hypothetical protein PHP99_06740 [Paludibacter sp.]|nr:hypothetical protein [Paludibacter sp.]
MSDALKATGMNFYFNICEWGEREPWLWAANAGGHSWRVSFDSCDTWDHVKYDGSHCGVIQSIDIMFSTPLLISFDLFTMNRATLDIHTNKELIANNQERLGQQTLCFFTRIIILNVEKFLLFT